VNDNEVTESLSEYIEVVNCILMKTHGAGVWIQGEIEGINGRVKHTYFTVVERSKGKKASVSVAVWKFTLRKMMPLLAQHRLELRDCIKLCLFGSGDLYVERELFSL
jgi:exonuclease VII large subunit